MNIFRIYDIYIKGLALRDRALGRIKNLNIVLLPILLALLAMPVGVDLMGMHGVVGLYTKVVVGSVLLIALIISGVRFIYHGWLFDRGRRPGNTGTSGNTGT